jgi:hypothetical protein
MHIYIVLSAFSTDKDCNVFINRNKSVTITYVSIVCINLEERKKIITTVNLKTSNVTASKQWLPLLQGSLKQPQRCKMWQQPSKKLSRESLQE